MYVITTYLFRKDKQKKRASVTFGAVKPSELFELLESYQTPAGTVATTTTTTATTTSLGGIQESKTASKDSTSPHTSYQSLIVQDDSLMQIQKEISQQSNLITLLSQQLHSLTNIFNQEISARELLEASFKSETDHISKQIELERKERVKLQLILEKMTPSSPIEQTQLAPGEKEKHL